MAKNEAEKPNTYPWIFMRHRNVSSPPSPAITIQIWFTTWHGPKGLSIKHIKCSVKRTSKPTTICPLRNDFEDSLGPFAEFDLIP
jgi:hypothetical protein